MPSASRSRAVAPTAASLRRMSRFGDGDRDTLHRSIMAISNRDSLRPDFAIGRSVLHGSCCAAAQPHYPALALA